MANKKTTSTKKTKKSTAPKRKTTSTVRVAAPVNHTPLIAISIVVIAIIAYLLYGFIKDFRQKDSLVQRRLMIEAER